MSSARLSYQPSLSRSECDGVVLWTDTAARERGVIVAFSERTGGVSEAPYTSLNLTDHVGDDPSAVDENRRRLLECVGLESERSALTMARMIHGDEVALVFAEDAGQGGFASTGRPPIPGVDAMLTALPRVPLLACSADCVGIVLVAPGPMVGVAHAGREGARLSVARRAVERMASDLGVDPSAVHAYLGPHIGGCHYPVDAETMSQFVNTFDTVARAESGGLDLEAVVVSSLTSAGVDSCNIVRLGVCTAEATDRFFSHRAEKGLTGRHGALVAIL